MIGSDDIRGVVTRLLALLDAHSIPYFVMGGLAVPIWGIPRATFDVDVTLSIDEHGLTAFLSAAKASGFTIDAARSRPQPEIAASSLPRRRRRASTAPLAGALRPPESSRHATILRPAGTAFETGFRDVLHGMRKLKIEWWTTAGRRVEVDIFLVTTPFQQAAFARRVRARIEDREMWVLTAADLILHKLLANRPKDLADVQNLLAVQGVPGAQYLRDWAVRLGVADRLDEAIARATSD